MTLGDKNKTKKGIKLKTLLKFFENNLFQSHKKTITYQMKSLNM